MTIGFNQPLYLLPFDHRESFETKLFGWHGALSAAQTAEIVAAKQVIYDGFQAAVAGGAPKEHAAILVDEQFGAAILRDAACRGLMTACPVEKSGQKEFDFEYGEEFTHHIEAFNPTFCKVLVRYNPEGDAALNERQTARLRQLSDYLHGCGRFLMFELLVAAEPQQLDRFHGDKKAYDLDLRPRLMVQTLHQLQDAGVEPDVWKVEGMDRHEDCVNFVEAARRYDICHADMMEFLLQHPSMCWELGGEYLLLYESKKSTSEPHELQINPRLASEFADRIPEYLRKEARP